MKKNWSTVDILRNTRHDWLNNLQLIKGNLDLNKIERVKEIIQEIIIETQHEAKLSNLHITNFAGNIMTFNWESYHFKLEFEVLGEIKNLSKYDDSLTEWTKLFFQLLNNIVEEYGENHLSITIDLHEQPCFFFDFSGIIKDADNLNGWLQNHENNDSLQLVEKSIHENEFSITLKLI